MLIKKRKSSQNHVNTQFQEDCRFLFTKSVSPTNPKMSYGFSAFFFALDSLILRLFCSSLTSL